MSSFSAFNTVPYNAINPVAPAVPTTPTPTVNYFGGLVTRGLGMRRGLVTGGLRGGIPSGLPTVVETGKGFLVLAEIQQMIRDAGLVSSQHVFFSMDPEPIEAPMWDFISIQPGPETERGPRFEGAGRNRFSVEGQFVVHVVTQSGSDVAYADDIRLLNATRGALSKAHAIADALHEKFVPSDDPQLDLTDEPLEFMTQREPVPYRGGKPKGWVRIAIVFRYTYTRKVTGSV